MLTRQAFQRCGPAWKRRGERSGRSPLLVRWLEEMLGVRLVLEEGVAGVQLRTSGG